MAIDDKDFSCWAIEFSVLILYLKSVAAVSKKIQIAGKRFVITKEPPEDDFPF